MTLIASSPSLAVSTRMPVALQEAFGDAAYRDRVVDDEGQRPVVRRRRCRFLDLNDGRTRAYERVDVENQT